MEHEKEEALAAILWRFIEEIREKDRLGAVLRLRPAEARELLDLLTLAAGVRDALSITENEVTEHTHARRRLDRALRDRSSPQSVREEIHSPRSPLSPRRPVASSPRRPRWTWASVAAIGAIAAGLAGLHVGWRLPRPDPLTHPPAAVQVLSHERVRQWLPRLLKEQLPPAQARAMWWHLAHCDGCFHAYQRMDGRLPHETGAARPGRGSLWVVALRSNTVEGLRDQSAWMR